MKKYFICFLLSIFCGTSFGAWQYLFDVNEQQWHIEDSSFKVLRAEENIFLVVLIKTFNKKDKAASDDYVFVIEAKSCLDSTGAFGVLNKDMTTVLHKGEWNAGGELGADKLGELLCIAAVELARKNSSTRKDSFI